MLTTAGFIIIVLLLVVAFGVGVHFSRKVKNLKKDVDNKVVELESKLKNLEKRL